jgi:pyrroloquinoline quinone biosynthesis protein E
VSGPVGRGTRPRLAAGVRVARDPVGGAAVLLGPERVCPLDGAAPEILALCDGRRTVGEIAAILAARHLAGVDEVSSDIVEFLEALRRPGPPADRPGPSGLLAELTHRCPLRCPYCSNPTAPPVGRGELTTGEWVRVLAEAASLGVLHVHFSGGEPLLRSDLPELVTAARSSGLYSNLITSGLGLTPARVRLLRDAGLDHVQVSLQADAAEAADAIAGRAAHARKLAAARAVVAAGLPLTINVVLHRANLDGLPGIIALAEAVGAARLELAHAQYYGWAMLNRAGLLPTRAQVEHAGRVVAEAFAERGRRTEIIHVRPDYFGDRPKACMNGWGRRQLTIDPVGDVLPCPTAREIASLRFENIRERPLGAIWSGSEAFNRFRGTAWMREPCRGCDRREVDFGGCRCQAFLLTGDPDAADPACSLSPGHMALRRVVEGAAAGVRPLVFRSNAPRPPTDGAVLRGAP